MVSLLVQQDGNDMYSAFSAVRLMIGRPNIGGAKAWETVLKIPGQRFGDSRSATEAIELIRSELTALEADGVLDGEWVLSIPPSDSNGFAIDLLQNAEPKTIRCLFGMLEQEFATLDEALVWVRLALSTSYQLRITSFGEQPKLWRLEPVDAASGAAALEMGHGVPFFWRGRKRSDVKRNSLPPDCEA